MFGALSGKCDFGGTCENACVRNRAQLAPPSTLVDPLSVFPARRKIAADIVVHFRFLRSPTPTAVRIFRDVGKRIELKL